MFSKVKNWCKKVVDKASKWTLEKVLDAANLRDLLGLAYLKSRRQCCPLTSLGLLIVIGIYRVEDKIARTFGWTSSQK